MGCHIEVKDDGSKDLDQNSYVDALNSLVIFEGTDDRELSEKKKKKRKFEGK